MVATVATLENHGQRMGKAMYMLARRHQESYAVSPWVYMYTFTRLRSLFPL